jgi:hypothetical protein
MKPYVDTWIYITKKCGKMRFIGLYRGILNYIMTQNPTIPNLFPIGDGFGLFVFFDKFEKVLANSGTLW